ncbi:MAG: hypothetical protein ACR2NB_02105 [Solirubrobacteraceae bacterium]
MPWVKPTIDALARHHLSRGFASQWRRGDPDGADVLRVRNSSTIFVTPQPPLPGVWDLHVMWEFRRRPSDRDVVVFASSVGINVRRIPLSPEQPVCLVRYDVDHDRPYAAPGRVRLGRHLNILQPAPLGDRVHFPVPGDEPEWSVPTVIDLLLSESFFADLQSRMGT